MLAYHGQFDSDGGRTNYHSVRMRLMNRRRMVPDVLHDSVGGWGTPGGINFPAD